MKLRLVRALVGGLALFRESVAGQFVQWLALLNPRGDAGKAVPQISDSSCLHRETTMSHTFTSVNAGLEL